MTKPAQRVFIQEVGPRDGFQIEPAWIPTDDKIAFINALSRTGLSKIEVSSFVSSKAVPNLRDAEEVFARIDRRPGVSYVALVATPRGAERAVAAKADEINLALAASETFNRANVQRSCAESLTGFRQIFDALRGGSMKVIGTLATAFGCPFEGAQSSDRVLGLVESYLELGVDTVCLADTTGMANPRQVAEAVARYKANFADVPLTLHFHNTRGMGAANILAGFQEGAVHFDSCLGGLGGCPFAPGATGNVCTEDVVHMFTTMGVATGVDLDALLAVARSLPGLIGHDVPGQVMKAGPSWSLHPAPAPRS